MSVGEKSVPPGNAREGRSYGESMVRYYNIPISEARPGMTLGRAIEDRMGRILAEAGSEITDYVLQGLKAYGVRILTIRYGEEDKSEADTILSPVARLKVDNLRRPDPAKLKLGVKVREQVSKGVEYIYSNPDEREIVETVNSITEQLLNAISKNNAVAINISDLKTSDEYTFNHSVDVATISMIIAKEQGMTAKQIFEIGSAGLLHDIGKTKIPPEILNKPAKLTKDEYEIVKQHSLLSYTMVKRNREIPPDVALGMLQHHEKVDGSGYPLGVMGNLIHPYAKIMTVADIYDALVSSRPYKMAYTPREAVEMMMSMSSSLDMQALQSFMRVTVLYPVDTLVELSNGETARVVRQNENLLLRPVVVGVRSGKTYDLSRIECASIVIAS